jgi:HD-like signal output (HDOD) protein
MLNNTHTTSAPGGAFAFVQGLAAELNKGQLKLPSFPEAVLRIRKALDDEQCTTERLARIAASDQVLAGRLVHLANSALLQRGGERATDLRTAIQRLGFAMVRNAAISVAMEQILQARAHGASVVEIKTLWRTSTRVAALSYVVARHCPQLNADEAFLAGLLHNIGKLYVLIRAAEQAALFADDPAQREALDGWHGIIGRLIVEHWGFSAAQAAAAEGYADLQRRPPHADLTDVVQVATMLDEMAMHPERRLTPLDEVGAWKRLGLRQGQAQSIIRESNEEIRAAAGALFS